MAEAMERKARRLIKELKETLQLEEGSKRKGEGFDSSEEEEKKEDEKEEDEDGEDDEEDFGFDPERYVPFNEKVQLADAMKKITKEGLTEIVNYLKEKQPEAVEDLGNDRLHLKIDMIEKAQFTHCMDIANHSGEHYSSKRQKT
eukprot:CAMPEP_0202962554 /NCGR_PEP_ID=MMETSP1396-20130829/6669_1 /ASSEMBLY_ACC=CAM_ASM_000872 /TAXON_ID= /ORGANISM="Pseudokeronopsis sp., Strain Brazil" /LENGTH=143 /DNA_ID=CAMNT_0049683235 /DNA_START=299 /DNA_END=726 /DNA_ORIENTATION=-